MVAPEDEADFGRIERAVGSKIPRVRVEGFAYGAAPDAPLEVPLGQRIAAIRAKKSEDRARSAAKAAKKTQNAQAAGASTRSGPRRRPFGEGRRRAG